MCEMYSYSFFGLIWLAICLPFSKMPKQGSMTNLSSIGFPRFKVKGLGFRVQGVRGLRSRVYGLGFRVSEA